MSHRLSLSLSVDRGTRTGRPLNTLHLALARKQKRERHPIAGPARGERAPKTERKKGCDMLSSIIILVRENRKVPAKREIDLSCFSICE